MRPLKLPIGPKHRRFVDVFPFQGFFRFHVSFRGCFFFIPKSKSMFVMGVYHHDINVVCVCVLYIFLAFCGLAIRRGKKTAKFKLKKSEKVRCWWCSSISFFWFQSNEFGKIIELGDSHNSFVAIRGDMSDFHRRENNAGVNVILNPNAPHCKSHLWDISWYICVMYNSDKSSTCPRIFWTGPVCKTFFADPELRARTRVPWVILLMEEFLHHVQPWFHGMFLQGFLSTRFWL